MILFTGGCLPQCMLGYHLPQSRHPLEQTPPPRSRPRQEQTPPSGADTSPESRHPREQTYTPLGADTPLPPAEHAGRYGQHAGGTHPTGMQSCVKQHFSPFDYYYSQILNLVSSGNSKVIFMKKYQEANHHVRIYLFFF